MKKTKSTITAKEINAVQPNYIVVNPGYSTLVFKHKDGLAFLAALETAECLKSENGDYEDKRIIPITNDCFTFSMMSYSEYKNKKMSTILGVKIDNDKK